jgi:polygalacturonase
MRTFRRELLKLAVSGLAVPLLRAAPTWAEAAAGGTIAGPAFNVRAFGAAGDGKAVDTPAINRAIEAAAASGGGTVHIPAGQYICYSIHLRSNVALYLDQGAAIVAGDTPHDGTGSGGYDAAESNAPWEAYQDYGHNHWHNSLIWGEGLHDIAIFGPGLIWGRGLSRGHDNPELPRAEAPGVGNKAIALKNCHNVLLRDFAILQGGHFGVLATGVDNLTMDNLRIDTNRDGINLDCCRNVHVSNCTVNSPWDDGICLKSSFALGYARATENVTVTSCYVTGGYEMGTLLDGTFRRLGPAFDANTWQRTGRIKCGTESNGGFKNITISNCVFESCRGLALETVDGGLLEDVTVTGMTMRDIRNAPLYLRLGGRMRGPPGVPIGRLARVLISNVTCHGPANDMPSIIAGLPGHPVEDVKISDCLFLHKGGEIAEMAAIVPDERAGDYPEPSRMGTLPAQHFYVRHARNVEFTNVELASASRDARPCFWMNDVQGADLFHLKLPEGNDGGAFLLQAVADFQVMASHGVKDTKIALASQLRI